MTPTSEARETPTKTYKDPVTGRVETAAVGSDVEKALIEQGYVEIDPATGEYKDPKAVEKAAADAMPKPLNPDAKVQTPEDIAAAKAAKPPVEPTGSPQGPAVPKQAPKTEDRK